MKFAYASNNGIIALISQQKLESYNLMVENELPRFMIYQQIPVYLFINKKKYENLDNFDVIRFLEMFHGDLSLIENLEIDYRLEWDKYVPLSNGLSLDTDYIINRPLNFPQFATQS